MELLFGAIHEFDTILRRHYARHDTMIEKLTDSLDQNFHFHYAKALYLLGEENHSVEFVKEAKDRIEVALAVDPTNPSFLDIRIACLNEQVYIGSNMIDKK